MFVKYSPRLGTFGGPFTVLCIQPSMFTPNGTLISSVWLLLSAAPSCSKLDLFKVMTAVQALDKRYSNLQHPGDTRVDPNYSVNTLQTFIRWSYMSTNLGDSI